MLCSCICLFSVQTPLNQIYVVVDVASLRRAKRHQSTLRLCPWGVGGVLPSRVTEDYCRNDPFRFVLFRSDGFVLPVVAFGREKKEF